MLNASFINQAGVFDVFDDISETLTAFTGWIPGFSPWTQELVQYADLESSTRLVDLGCGTGRLLAALGRREPGASFTGVDSDRDSVTIAKRRSAAGPGKFEIRNADLETLPFEDERFRGRPTRFRNLHVRRQRRNIARLQASDPYCRYEAPFLAPPRQTQAGKTGGGRMCRSIVACFFPREFHVYSRGSHKDCGLGNSGDIRCKKQRRRAETNA
jgi:SAM-dependent methyltransferase